MFLRPANFHFMQAVINGVLSVHLNLVSYSKSTIRLEVSFVVGTKIRAKKQIGERFLRFSFQGDTYSVL